MKLIQFVDAYYPTFPLGGEPTAVKCKLNIVESNGKLYLQTPFAFLDSCRDDELEYQFNKTQGAYYRTLEDCQKYLDFEYPHWKLARPLMEKILNHPRLFSYQLVRGHRSFTIAQIEKELS